MVLNRLEKEIQEIREHQAADSLPDPLWEEINAIEDWEVYSSREGLPVLSNFDSEDPDLNQLLDEVYEGGIEIAEIYEFSEKISEDPTKTPQEGPSFEVETSEGFLRVYPVWEKYDSIYTLSLISDDEYVDVEIFTLRSLFITLRIEEKDLKDIDVQEAVFDSVKEWVEGL